MTSWNMHEWGTVVKNKKRDEWEKEVQFFSFFMQFLNSRDAFPRGLRDT